MALVGVPGSVYTPARGTDLPGFAFGHGWMTSAGRYERLLRHLATWGIVAAAPNTERGPLASDAGLAADLDTTLSVISQTRLGTGDITVHPERLAIGGHGFGAAAAVLATHGAAAAVQSIAALFPAPASPNVEVAATATDIPALVLGAPGELDTVSWNPLPMRTWLGDTATLRVLPKGNSRGIVEGRSAADWVLDTGGDKKVQAAVRAVLTGYLLATLTGDKQYRPFTDPEEVLGGIATLDPATVEDDGLDLFSRLLKS